MAVFTLSIECVMWGSAAQQPSAGAGGRMAQQAVRLRSGYCRVTVMMHSAAAMYKVDANTFSDLVKMVETLDDSPAA